MSVEEAYAGQILLLTGVTGFLGKVLFERLLWEFPDIAEIRLLLRPGSHSSAQARFEEEVLASPIFSRLEKRSGGLPELLALLRSKVRTFAADIGRKRLGLDDINYEEIASGLDLIIHSAALVNWDERLDRSIQNNTLGARHVLQLARHAGHAKLVHVSTCWVHGQRRGRCPENIAQTEVSVDEEVQAALSFGVQAENESHQSEVHELLKREAQLRHVPSDSSREALQEELRVRWVHKRVADWGVRRATANGWWDNYTYSKALAEALLAREHGSVPVAVVRPSGITGALKDPEPGWTDAYLLTEPLIEGVGKKTITEFPGNPSCVIDTIPVDMVANVILVAGSSLLHNSRESSEDVLVYQVASGDTSPLTLGEIEVIWREHFAERPFLQPVSAKPITGLRPIVFWKDAATFSAALRRRYVAPLQLVQRGLEVLPGWERVGMLRQARGAVVRQWRTVEKVLQLAKLYSSYTLNEWLFETIQTRELMGALNPDDQRRFIFEPRTIHWLSFWKEVHIPGMRRHVLKEPAFQTMSMQAVSRL